MCLDLGAKMPVRLTVVVLTYRRDEALAATLDRLRAVMGVADFRLVLVDNNGDGRDRSRLLSGFADARLVNEGRNLGVAAGRNRAMEQARGEVVLFVDDDALIEAGPDFAERLVSAFRENPRLGCVAFRSVVGEAGRDDPSEFPHTDKSRPRDAAFETFRFIGVAHALRLEAGKDAGSYCESFFYGMEEFDLSYRLLKNGWTLEYRPEFRVRHMKNPSGRLLPAEIARRMYANKLSVAWMHLPSAQFSMCAAAWFVKTTVDARNPFTALFGLSDFATRVWRGEIGNREPSRSLARKVESLGGRAWK